MKERKMIMGKIYKSITELVGHTPLVELTNYEKKHELKATLLGKLEYFNPSGSVKDRAALNMIEEAEKSGKLKPGQTIVDNTSGNTGIALAAFGHAKGHEFVTFLEPGVSREREDIFKAYGVDQYWFTDISERVKKDLEAGALNLEVLEEDVQAYADENGYFYIDQCSNEYNTEAHYKTTGPEIWEDTDGKVDIVVLLAGTGGTISGLSKFFKEKDENIKIIGVQPDVNSRLDANNKTGNTIDGVFPIDINGISIIPLINKFNTVIDEIVDVSSEDAYSAAKELVRSDGIFLGQSAAAALYAATQVAKRPENEGKNIVIIMADDGTKYLSTNLYK